jgi:TfoX N-terminal domain
MAFDEALAARIRKNLAHRKRIEERKMFGCLAFLASGHAVVGVWKRSLIARVGPDSYEDALLEPHIREFDITGKPMRGCVVVGPGGVEDDGQLAEWVRRALEVVGTLPAT